MRFRWERNDRAVCISFVAGTNVTRARCRRDKINAANISVQFSVFLVPYYKLFSVGFQDFSFIVFVPYSIRKAIEPT